MEVCKLLKTIIRWSTLIPFRWHECKFMCFYCDHHFVEASKFRQHIDTHPDVDINNILLRVMYKNYGIKLDVKQIWCTMCHKEFEIFDEYMTHLSEEHELAFGKGVVEQLELFELDDEEMRCLECGKSFKYFLNLLTHTHKMHVDVERTHKYLCEVCGQGFGARSSVLGHISQVHRLQKCRFCDETFMSRYALYNHVGSVHIQEKLKCPLCPKILPNRYLRKRHLALEHDCKREQLFCDFCNKMFTRRNKLDIHRQKMHFKEKISCEVCGVIFSSMKSLMKHSETHEEQNS